MAMDKKYLYIGGGILVVIVIIVIIVLATKKSSGGSDSTSSETTINNSASNQANNTSSSSNVGNVSNSTNTSTTVVLGAPTTSPIAAVSPASTTPPPASPAASTATAQATKELNAKEKEKEEANRVCIGGDTSLYKMYQGMLIPGKSMYACQRYGDIEGNGKGGFAALQSDGDFTLFSTETPDAKIAKPYWHSDTANKGEAPYKASFTQKGDFVIVDAKDKVLYSTNTEGKNGSVLRYNHRDGNFVMTTAGAGNNVVWSTNTAGFKGNL